MGIKDLLRFMKPYTQSIHIQKYAGHRVGIDAYSWLHKGAYSCSMELCLNTEGEKKLQYLNYFMHRINLLKHYKVTPVVVFDGGSIPCKSVVEDERFRRRKANREMAMEKLKEGNIPAAQEFFQRGISITTSMVRQLMQKLRSENVEFLVAPYEADAQLAYMSGMGEERGGIVTIITEDSDLLAYGCPSITFKMDKYGNGEEIELEKVFNSTTVSKPSFRNFTPELFTGMCVLAGCDFLASVPGIGISKAHAFVCKYHNLDRVLSVLKYKKGNQMPEDYLRSFKEAVAVFQHAMIYDVNRKKLQYMKPLPTKVLEFFGEELDFLGPEMTASVATAIAEGYLDPTTMEAFKYSSPSSIIMSDPSSDTSPVSTADSCFTLCSSSKFVVQKQVLKERNQLDEIAILAKLASPLDVPDDKENFPISDEFSRKTPNNNPFKKRKLEQARLAEIESPTEGESGVTEVEKQELCRKTDSQDSVSSKPKKGEKKLKTRDPKSLQGKTSSILNFFACV